MVPVELPVQMNLKTEKKKTLYILFPCRARNENRSNPENNKKAANAWTKNQTHLREFHSSKIVFVK